MILCLRNRWFDSVRTNSERSVLKFPSSKSNLLILGALVLLFQLHLNPLSHAAVHKTKEILVSDFGFKLIALNEKWKLTPPPPGQDDIIYIFRASKVTDGIQGTLTVRRQLLQREDIGVERYTRKYIHDFPKFGYSVVASSKITVGDVTGSWIETQQPKSLKKIRQTIFVKDGQAIIFTCADHKERFHETVNECQKLISGFRWTTPTQPRIETAVSVNRDKERAPSSSGVATGGATGTTSGASGAVPLSGSTSTSDSRADFSETDED